VVEKASDLSRPIREAARDAFYQLILDHFTHQPLVAINNFLSEAGGRGFLYPLASDPYSLANDYACWLDGISRMVEEFEIHPTPIPPIQIDSHSISITAFEVDSTIHLFRCSDSADDKWDSLLAQTLELPILLHTFTLPYARSGRISHPLVTLYRHPSLPLYRLAPLEGERFSPKWSRLYRWESPEFSWEEWREGIARDQCIERIYTTRALEPLIDPQPILTDALAILDALPLPHPRHRESCNRCLYPSICFGERNDRPDPANETMFEVQ
jgi:hypothetical protein